MIYNNIFKLLNYLQNLQNLVEMRFGMKSIDLMVQSVLAATFPRQA